MWQTCVRIPGGGAEMSWINGRNLGWVVMRWESAGKSKGQLQLFAWFIGGHPPHLWVKQHAWGSWKGYPAEQGEEEVWVDMGCFTSVPTLWCITPSAQLPQGEVWAALSLRLPAQAELKPQIYISSHTDLVSMWRGSVSGQEVSKGQQLNFGPGIQPAVRHSIPKYHRTIECLLSNFVALLSISYNSSTSSLFIVTRAKMKTN